APCSTLRGIFADRSAASSDGRNGVEIGQRQPQLAEGNLHGPFLFCETLGTPATLRHRPRLSSRPIKRADPPRPAHPGRRLLGTKAIPQSPTVRRRPGGRGGRSATYRFSSTPEDRDLRAEIRPEVADVRLEPLRRRYRPIEYERLIGHG